MILSILIIHFFHIFSCIKTTKQNSMNLKQPTKFTHQNLNKAISQKQQEQIKSIGKTKPISKLQDKKKINKKNEPSAIRLAAINETFHKIQQNAEQMINEFDIDTNQLKHFLNFHNKCKCLCGRNIKYYCLKCMFKNPQLTFPSVQLPIHTTIVHHSSQKINKSSIVPMCLLSNNISKVLFNPIAKIGEQGNQQQIIDNIAPELRQGTYILYPHKDSTLVTPQLVPQIKNIIVLDCTWFQTDQVVSSLSKRGLNKFIRLDNYQSLYWRYNHHSDHALSSAEALIYFLREYQKSKSLNTKMYDPLMFLYCLNLKIVQQSYRHQKKKPIHKQQVNQEKQEGRMEIQKKKEQQNLEGND